METSARDRSEERVREPTESDQDIWELSDDDRPIDHLLHSDDLSRLADDMDGSPHYVGLPDDEHLGIGPIQVDESLLEQGIFVDSGLTPEQDNEQPAEGARQLDEHDDGSEPARAHGPDLAAVVEKLLVRVDGLVDAAVQRVVPLGDVGNVMADELRILRRIAADVVDEMLILERLAAS
jgi:hypothetical protein